MKQPATRLAFCALGLFAYLPPALGGVHVVDSQAGAGFDFTDIQAAVDNALPGDLILVRSGTYPAFAVDAKPLTVTADSGATVILEGTGTLVSVRNLPTGSSFVLDGIQGRGTFVSSFRTSLSTILVLEDNAGRVLIQDGDFEQGSSNPFGAGQLPALRVSDCSSVTLTRTLLTHGGVAFAESDPSAPTVRAEGSILTFFDSEVIGQEGVGCSFLASCSAGEQGGPALELADGFAFASDTIFRGGRGGLGASDIFGCADAGDGGPAVHLGAGDPEFVLVGGTLLGGPSGGASVPCSTGTPGPASRVDSGTVESLAPSARTFHTPTPLREGSLSVLTFEGQAGDLVWHLISLKQNPLYLASANGTLFPGSGLLVFFEGTLPASGVKTSSFTVLDLGPGFEAVQLFEQAAFFNATDGFVLSSGQSKVLMDAAVGS